MMKAAVTLPQIRETCSPKPLDGKDLNDFFVETGDARDELRNLRDDLRLSFEASDGIRRALVYGHRGCGKSTELNELKKELGKDWFVVGFSINDYLPPVGMKAEDILLAIAAAIFEQSGDLKIGDKHLKKVHDFFTDVTVTDSSRRNADLVTTAGAGMKDGSLWSGLTGLHASIKASLSLSSKHEKSIVHKIRQRPSELVVALDGLLEAVKTAVELRGQRFLIIVEDLDKIGLADAHDIFVRNSQLLASPAANIIYTIPLFTFYSSEAEVIRAQFDETFVFPMLKVVDLQKNKATGYAIVEKIVRKRVAKSILEDDALDLLIRGTGGVLRDVFESLQLVSTFRTIKNRAIIRDDIREALNRISLDRGVQIGWPADENGMRKPPTDLFERLADIARRQADGLRVRPTNESTIEVLLRSGALIEYNGDRWLGVHPFARKYLADLNYDVGPDPYGLCQ